MVSGCVDSGSIGDASTVHRNQWTPCQLSQEGSGVAVVCDMVSVVTDLSIPELLCQVQADQVGTIEIGDRLRLVHRRRDQNFVTHLISFELKSVWHGSGRIASDGGHLANCPLAAANLYHSASGIRLIKVSSSYRSLISSHISSQVWSLKYSIKLSKANCTSVSISIPSMIWLA